VALRYVSVGQTFSSDDHFITGPRTLSTSPTTER
jgi:hypothetical protein